MKVTGDLSQPRFGWSEEEFAERAKQIDVIYHNGATVNAMLPYSLLQAHNVTSTAEILSLACTSKYVFAIILFPKKDK
jgi:thioester reductase-like protein